MASRRKFLAGLAGLGALFTLPAFPVPKGRWLKGTSERCARCDERVPVVCDACGGPTPISMAVCGVVHVKGKVLCGPCYTGSPQGCLFTGWKIGGHAPDVPVVLVEDYVWVPERIIERNQERLRELVLA